MTEPKNTRHPYWPELTDEEGDALSEWFDDTCGDCIEGRCHWGGEASKQSIAAVARGEEYEDPAFGRCGCARHKTSVLARAFRGHDTTQANVIAWRDAKARGEVGVIDDE